jgi:AcrR family transcriptional regulator
MREGEHMTVYARREREQSVRRELIIETARRFFETKGFERTTVEEIAEKAELGKGTIYSYFQSKEQIYIAILEQDLTVLIEQIEQVSKNPNSAIETLQKMYDVYIRYHLERKGFVEGLFVQINQQQLFQFSELIAGLKRRASVLTDSIAKVLRLGIAQGEFKVIDVDQTAQILIGVILGLIIHFEIGQTHSTLEDYKKPVFKMILDGIRRF